ncbi:MAG: tripartite tricarboxylate transporter TctB family protein [Smithellaceae bacterium]|nr:tripartite tricarboxylate transporter TctB family protein [Smithellaceae bacterium]
MNRFNPLQKMEMTAASVVIALGAFVTLYSYYVLRVGMMISPDAGFLPFLMGIALLVLGACWFAKSLLFTNTQNSASADGLVGYADEEETPPEFQSRKHLWGFLVILGFAIFIERAGFFITTALFMLAWQLIVEKEKWLMSLLITVLTAGAMYTIFRLLLKIHLPSGEWFS